MVSSMISASERSASSDEGSVAAKVAVIRSAAAFRSTTSMGRKRIPLSVSSGAARSKEAERRFWGDNAARAGDRDLRPSPA